MNKDTRRRLSDILVPLGLLSIMTGTLLPLLQAGGDLYRWLYAAGALLLLAGRLVAPGVGADAPMRLRRLIRLEVWTSLIFVAGAVFCFMPQGQWRDCVAFTLAGGVLTIYTSILIPRQKLHSAGPEKDRTHDR